MGGKGLIFLGRQACSWYIYLTCPRLLQGVEPGIDPVAAGVPVDCRLQDVLLLLGHLHQHNRPSRKNENRKISSTDRKNDINPNSHGVGHIGRALL